MNENSMARNGESPMCEDEPWLQRSGRGWAVGGCQNSSGGGISATLDASYYKGTGSRNGNEREFIAMSIGNGQTNNASMSETANTLDCMHDQQAVIYPGVGITSKENASNPLPGDPAPTISTDSRNYLVEKKPQRKYIVRRLTPTECARLQGFPDWWTEIDEKAELSQEETEFWEDNRKTRAGLEGKTYKVIPKNTLIKWLNSLKTDSAEYKMWGNGIALPCAVDVIGRCAKALRENRE